MRELRRKRVWWCAEPLVSSATQEVRRLLVVARQWAERLDQPVRGWMSDKPEACVTAIADAFVGPPHRYCHNHFRRDLAQPVRDLDRRAQVKRRRQVRGLRAIARRVWAERRHVAAPESLPPDERPKTEESPRVDASGAAAAPCASSAPSLVLRDSAMEATGIATTGDVPVADEMGEVVLGYCAAVRGILNDSQGGPLHPPGLRMREALEDVRDSLERNLQAKKGGLPSCC